MKKLQNITRLLVLVASLCLAVSVGCVWASDTASAASGHGILVAQAQAADNAAHGTDMADAHGEEAAGHGDGHGEGSLSADKLKDLFWRVINFIALMIILVKFGAKPIANGLSGRQKRIREELEELETRKAEAEKSYREFEAKLASVEKDIDSVVEKALAQAEIEKAKIIERAEQAAEDIKRQAEQTIHHEVMEARRNLKNEAAEQAAIMAEELIVKNLKPQDQVKIIEDYLEKVGAVQ